MPLPHPVFPEQGCAHAIVIGEADRAGVPRVRTRADIMSAWLWRWIDAAWVNERRAWVDMSVVDTGTIYSLRRYTRDARARLCGLRSG